ncbi:F-box/WD repeat-containing protein 1A-like [Daphnia carinata]|uniref:F-box/WD repeat-containing protein 1A-like n=1 Tax=Daphnia carinata TaxID=120202 RepID=UPI00257ACA11|nr:F-box/WD repeat-containing protein 1A-like [Daphnia carinata]XP_059351346.1 F-box/WD repeat-containing protein 1A-like [Daphnia carinata]
MDKFITNDSRIADQLDIIQQLHEKCLDSVMVYIFSLLGISDLRTTETVCKLWYSIVKKKNLWEKLYQRHNVRSSTLKLLLDRRTCEGFNTAEDEFLHKRLLNAYEKVQHNWATGTCVKKSVNVGHCSRFVMDSKRVITLDSTLRVTMWNRWTLEEERLPLTCEDGISELTHLQLAEDLVFCSYRDGTIVAWDIMEKAARFRFKDENISGCDLKIHTAHGLLVSFVTVTGPVRGCDQTRFSVRSLQKPFSIVADELTTRIPCARVKDVTSDSNYFVVFLFCSNNYVVSADDVKIQLRSVDTFEVLREVCGIIPSDHVFKYFDGWLIAGIRTIRIWDIEKSDCQHVIPQSNSSIEEYETLVVDIQLDGERLIIRDNSGTFNVWLFCCKKGANLSSRMGLLSNNNVSISSEPIARRCEKFKFDELQIVTVERVQDDLRGPFDLLIMRNFF